MKFEPPEQLTQKNIIYWSPEAKSLNVPKGKARLTKAKKFLSLSCIKLDGENFTCVPIPGYNKTTYNGTLTECNCQFFQTTNQTCSHILAATMFKEIQENKCQFSSGETFKKDKNIDLL